MTYMYELPQYVELPMSAEVNASFPKYKLLLYGEGEGKKYDKLLRNREKLTGIPVLFIPGNAGSGKQVRSLASVALRKSIEEYKYKTHFDYFSVDFEEEWTAFYGGSLEQQTQFVCACVTRILDIYRNNGEPQLRSVVLVGHSMGGVVAKAVMTRPELLPGPAAVQLIINLAAPATPVLLMDAHTETFYRAVDAHWTAADSGSGVRARWRDQLSLVSISGGLRDIQVRSGLAADPHADINTVTAAIPGAWVSADHKCIVWCKQVVLAITRALFDLVTPVTRQITADKKLRDSILHYHLVHRPWGKQYDPDNWRPGPVAMDKGGYWADILPRQFSLERGAVTREHYNMIKIAGEDVSQRMLTLDAVHMEADHWVYGCRRTELHRNTRVCVEAESVSSGSVILPSRGKRKMIQLDLWEMEKKGYSHIVVNIPKDSEKSKINIDVYNPRERSVAAAVPKWINFWRQQTVVERTVPGAVWYNVTLTGLEQAWQAYYVTATPTQCRTDTDLSSAHYGLARFVTPWSPDAVHALLGRPGEAELTNSVVARLQTSRPANSSAEPPRVELLLDPACQYAVRVQPSIVAMMGQMVRFYAPLLLPCMAAVNILIIAFQFRRMESDRFCQSTVFTLVTAVSPINVVLPSRMLAYVLTQVSPLETDINIIQNRGLDFGVLPIMMFFISIGLVFLVSCAAWLTILACGSMAHQAVMRWATRAAPHEIVAEVAVASLSKFPSILSCILMALAGATCGSLALCVGCFCYFLKLFKMYQEYLEGLVKRAVGLRAEDDPAILLGLNYQLSLALLWLLATATQLPTLVTWTQQLRAGAGPSLAADPSLAPAITMSLALAVLWQNEGQPRVDRKYFSVVAVVLQGAAICIATFAMVHLYRLSYIVSGVFVVVALHQALAPVRDPEEEAADEDDDEDESNKEAEGRSKLATAENSEDEAALSQGSQCQSGASSAAASDSEYEYEYKVNLVKRKVAKSATDTSITDRDTGNFFPVHTKYTIYIHVILFSI